MQQFLDWDQITYCNNIVFAIKNNEIPILYPHHFLMESSGKIFHQIMAQYLGKYGFNRDVVFNLRIRSLIIACAGIFFTIIVIHNLTKKFFWGILSGILIAFCHGYLVYSTKVDTAIFPAAWIIIIFFILQKIETARKRHMLLALIAGVSLFWGVMFHQYMVFVGITLCFSLIIPPFVFKKILPTTPLSIIGKQNRNILEVKPSIRYKSIAIIAISSICLTFAVYFYIGVSFYKYRIATPSITKREIKRYHTSFQEWIFGYVVLDMWGHGLEKFNPAKPFWGYTEAFLSQQANPFGWGSFKFIYNMDDLSDEQALTHNLVAIFTLVTIAGSLIFLPYLWKRYGRCFVFILSNLVLFVFFTTYWEPHYFEFWLIPLIMVCFLGILLLNFLAEKLSPFLKRFSHMLFYGLILIFIFYIASYNIINRLVPFSRRPILTTYDPNQPYWHLFSRDIYKYPDNPYRNLLAKPK